jgi:hypothetical protein
VLLPLLLDAFPAWCRSTGSCDIAASDILIVTLPQPMVVEMLLKGGIRLGSAAVPIHKPGVFPDFVMGGSEPLQRLAAAGIIERRATVFARHRGLGLLLAKRLAHVADLEGFASGVGRVVLASHSEPTARNQYVATLRKLIGTDATSRLLACEVGVFPGRLGIQHRDVPYAVLNDLADGGIIFAHLAQFYALSFPDALRAVSVPAAAEFGARPRRRPTVPDRRRLRPFLSRRRRLRLSRRRVQPVERLCLRPRHRPDGALRPPSNRRSHRAGMCPNQAAS